MCRNPITNVISFAKYVRNRFGEMLSILRFLSTRASHSVILYLSFAFTALKIIFKQSQKCPSTSSNQWYLHSTCIFCRLQTQNLCNRSRSVSMEIFCLVYNNCGLVCNFACVLYEMQRELRRPERMFYCPIVTYNTAHRSCGPSMNLHVFLSHALYALIFKQLLVCFKTEFYKYTTRHHLNFCLKILLGRKYRTVSSQPK